jgi:hypothetical protein
VSLTGAACLVKDAMTLLWIGRHLSSAARLRCQPRSMGRTEAWFGGGSSGLAAKAGSGPLGLFAMATTRASLAADPLVGTRR